MKNMGDYHEPCLKKDVQLYVDVFETFIDTCLIFQGLDPYIYFSSLGLSWDGMLKTTRVKPEKNSGIDMCLLIEKGF